ncbi:transmembrane protein 156 isoform X3 [Macaca thibetana thibetana]|uniref:transmembrane protein 156 isoform X3 n=1 Tax=Macaca thibetana thibetana TaxID=257877 RepID=UPI0021BCD416|nr:transmembrane protein 156 isoform X3 [Macaca thibetana thibetana]
MTKTALLKLFVAIVITFILILPEYFKIPKERTLELSCLEVCLQSNFTYSLSSLNFSFVTFLQSVRETQIIMRIFLNPSHFHNFTRTCQDITVLIRRGSMEVKANDFHSPCQHFNFTVAPLVDHLEEYSTTCHLKNHTGRSAIMEDEPSKGKSINHTCRIMEYPNDCIHISLHLEMDVKNITCSMKITWYILVLLVFMFLIILTIRKILEGHRRVQKWQSHRDKSTSVLLRGSDSEKLRALNVQVISAETTQRLPLDEVQEVLPPIPEL